MVDLSPLHKTDLKAVLRLRELDCVRVNKDRNTVVIRAFIGGTTGRQSDQATSAMNRVFIFFKERGIKIDVQWYTIDYVMNEKKWSVDELISDLLRADVHFLACHLHEGMVARSRLGDDSWNMNNILHNLDRLTYHVGFPMGKHVKCPVLRSDKTKLYECLSRQALCIPAMSIALNDQFDSEASLAMIDRLVVLYFETLASLSLN